MRREDQRTSGVSEGMAKEEERLGESFKN